jgi:two-component system NtrC family sensor kinase
MVEETPQNAKLLVADDEEANVRLLEGLLRQAGYTNLKTTTDSRRVLALYTQFQPDLVLLDLRMPHRDGFQILEDLELVIPKGSYVPVLVLTADVARETLRRALLAGAKDFLTKPFDAQEVLLRIRNLLQTRFLHLALQYQNRVLEERVQQRTQQVLQMEKLSAMGHLLAGVAHELNNPLAVVSGQAQLLQRVSEGTPQGARAEKIVKAAHRCVRIVRNFLALARERPPERTAVDLNAVVREAVELLSYELRTDSVEVIWELADNLPRLWADPHQLHQVMVNLVTNAHHAMRRKDPPRVLSVTTRGVPDPPSVQLTVRDTGLGIPREIQGRIFDPFFTTKPPGQGTGLGLSLSHTIIEDHGGTIRVADASAQGTTFVIELPLSGPPSASTPPPASHDVGPLASRRILIVDDETDVAGVLVDLLQADGHEVDTVTNGAEALAKLDQRPYDVILSDTKMPVLDGLGFFAEVERRFPELRRRIAFVTGDVLSADKRTVLDRIGAPVLAKPFDLNEIRSLVRRLGHA